MYGSRIEWIDSCKGFTIFWVVLGHIFYGYIDAGMFSEYTDLMVRINNIIYSFHMPLFFCLSGYVFWLAYIENRIEKRSKFKVQVINIIWTYFFWDCAMWVLKTLFAEDISSKLTFRDLVLIPIKPISPYWYLYVLVFLYIIMYFVTLTRINEFVILFLFGCVSISTGFIKFNTVFPTREIMFYSLPFYLGMLLAKYKEYRMKKILYILSCVGAGGLLVYSGIANIVIREIFIVGVFASLLVSWGWILLFQKVAIFSKTNVFNLCGQYSLEIYVIHCFIIAACRSFFIKMDFMFWGLHIIGSIVLGIGIPIVFAMVLKKCGLYTLLFRPATFFYET